MAPDYTSEIFHPSHSRHNTRMSTYKLDLPFVEVSMVKELCLIFVQKHLIAYQPK